MDPATRHLADVLFGGKVFVMGGDLRQILSVVQRGQRADVMHADLNQSATIWRHVRVLRLHTNMRAQRLLAAAGAGAADAARRQQEWADFLKFVGDGTLPAVGEDHMLLPEDLLCPGATARGLIDHVYGGMAADPAARA